MALEAGANPKQQSSDCHDLDQKHHDSMRPKKRSRGGKVIRQSLRFLTCLILAMGSPASAAPAPKPVEHWEALSTTAEAITGDILLSETRITFQNGASLELAYVGMVPDVVRDKPKGALARIYRIVHPKDLVLLHGNRLCGEPVDVGSFSRPSYYMAVAENRFGTLDGIVIAFIVGPLPVGPDPEKRRNCGEFGFVRPQHVKE